MRRTVRADGPCRSRSRSAAATTASSISLLGVRVRDVTASRSSSTSRSVLGRTKFYTYRTMCDIRRFGASRNTSPDTPTNRRTEIAASGPVPIRSRRWLILAVLCLSLFLVVVDSTIVNVALPTLSRELGAGTRELQWIVDAYPLVFASLLLAFGNLGDRYGRKGALQAAMGVGAALVSRPRSPSSRTCSPTRPSRRRPSGSGRRCRAWPSPCSSADVWCRHPGIRTQVGLTWWAWPPPPWAWSCSCTR